MVTYYTEWGEDQTVRECVRWTVWNCTFIVVQCLKFLLFYYRSFVGTGTRPANYPNANRYIEALVKRLTALHCPARIGFGPSPVSLRLESASSCTTSSDPQPAIPQYQELVAGSMTSYRRKVKKRKKMGEYVHQYNPRSGPTKPVQQLQKTKSFTQPPAVLWQLVLRGDHRGELRGLDWEDAPQGIHQQEEETAPARWRGPDSWCALITKLWKNQKNHIYNQKKNQTHQTVKNSTILPCTLHYLSKFVTNTSSRGGKTREKTNKLK